MIGPAPRCSACQRGWRIDPWPHQKLVDEAKTIIKGYSDYLASEPSISDLDDSPFVPLSIKAAMTATLAALSKAIV